LGPLEQAEGQKRTCEMWRNPKELSTLCRKSKGKSLQLAKGLRSEGRQRRVGGEVIDDDMQRGKQRSASKKRPEPQSGRR